MGSSRYLEDFAATPPTSSAEGLSPVVFKGFLMGPNMGPYSFFEGL